MERNNYRGIVILNIAFKILAKKIEDEKKEYQGGFRRWRLVENQVFSLREILAGCHIGRIRLLYLFTSDKDMIKMLKH